MPRRKPEPTLPGNPRELTINQHVHSRWCISQFADHDGVVSVLRRERSAPFPAKPDSQIFCAQRAWDEKLEHGLFAKVEQAFHAVVTSTLSGASIAPHHAVSAYVAIWQIRSNFALQPPEDVTLAGVNSAALPKDKEEILEKKGCLFARGSIVPGRFGAYISALRAYDLAMRALKEVRWGVFRSSGVAGFICPDRPKNELYIPVSPKVAFVAGYTDRAISEETVHELNRSAAGQAAQQLFGHPSDVTTSLFVDGASPLAGGPR
jgi:hypothetical protein